MKIDYIARKVNLSDGTRELAEKKLAKITKYFNDILDIRFEVGLERHLHVVDLSIRGKDFDVQAKTQNKDLMAAIQEAVDKLEIQARRAKARLKDHKARGSDVRKVQGWDVEVFEPTSASSGGRPKIPTTTIRPRVRGSLVITSAPPSLRPKPGRSSATTEKC